MKNYFKVKFGYGNLDFVSVDELELQKAIYAMFTHKPVQLGNSFVQGDKIISITPHWNKYTGWNENYQPTEADDWKQIKRDCPDLQPMIEQTKDYVALLMKENRIREIGSKPITENLIGNENFIKFSGMLAESKRFT